MVKFWSLKGQCENSENRRLFDHRFPRKHRNYNLRREKADSDYNYKRRETVVGSHVPIITAVRILRGEMIERKSFCHVFIIYLISNFPLPASDALARAG